MYTNIYLDRAPMFKYGGKIICHLWDDEIGYYNFPVTQVAYEKNKMGSYTDIYGNKLIQTSNFVPKDPTLIESDVSLETRILIDKYGNNDVAAKNIKIMFFDIETDATDGFPNIEHADKVITAITLYDSTLKKYISLIKDESKLVKNSSTNEIDIYSFPTEEELLYQFILLIRELKPTIISGWNSEQFDMLYIHNRIKNMYGPKVLKQLSEIGIVDLINNKHTGSSYVKIAGINHIDYMNLYKKFTFVTEPSYALNAIGLKVVNLGKIEYSGSLNDLYKNDINKYLEYNINDVKILVALEEKLRYIEQAVSLCSKCHVPYDKYEKSSMFIEGAILTYLRKENLISKNKPFVDEEAIDRTVSNFEGAFVKEPQAGLHQYVIDLDLTSMYPSIMRSLNMSPETKVGVVTNWDSEAFLRNTLTNIIFNDKSYTSQEFKQFLIDNNYSISINGVLFDLSKKGIITQILENWFNERVEYRKLEKKYATEGNTELYTYYHHKQLITKILLNSIYGVMGLRSFRFYDKDVASAVTMTGQFIIKSSAKIVNAYYNEKLRSINTKHVDRDHVIYIDTDSLFLSLKEMVNTLYPEITEEKDFVEKILQLTPTIQKYINDMYNPLAKSLFNIDTHFFDIKQEVISKAAFFVSKKKYCQSIINKNGVPKNEFEIKGLDVVRSSFPKKFQVFFKEFLLDMLNSTTKPVLDKKILSFEKSLSTYEILELAKTTSVSFKSKRGDMIYEDNTRADFSIKKRTPIGVKAALHYNDLLKKLKLDRKCEPIMNGQKIKFLYLKQNIYGFECIAFKADDTDPKEVLDFIITNMDAYKMYENELKTKLIKFYDVLKWQYPSIANVSFSYFLGD